MVLAGADSSRWRTSSAATPPNFYKTSQTPQRKPIIGALEIALENRDWEEDRDDIYELLLRANVKDAALRCDKLAAAIGLLSDELLNDDDREPAWVSVAVKVFVVGAATALAIATRDELSWPMVATVLARGLGRR